MYSLAFARGLKESYSSRTKAVFYARICLNSLYLFFWLHAFLGHTSNFSSAKLDLIIIITAYIYAYYCHKLKNNKNNKLILLISLILDLLVNIFFTRNSGYLLSPLMAIHPFLSAAFLLLFSNPFILLAPMLALPLLSALATINIAADSIQHILPTLIMFCALDVIAIFFISFVHSKEQNLMHKAYAMEKKLKELAIIKERQRISQEFHDGVGAKMTSIVMQCDILEINNPTNLKLLAEIMEIRESAIESIDDMRRSIAFLNRNFDLGEQLNLLVQNFKNRHSLNIELAGLENLVNISPEAQVACCRITQESLTNIIKHANASQVLVQGSFSKMGTKLIIKDNGQGFDVDLKRAAQYGLKNMAQRAKNIGGHLSISSEKNRGTSISLTLKTP